MTDNEKVRARLDAFQAELEKLCQTHDVRLEWAPDWVMIRDGYKKDAHTHMFDYDITDVGLGNS